MQKKCLQKTQQKPIKNPAKTQKTPAKTQKNPEKPRKTQKPKNQNFQKWVFANPVKTWQILTFKKL